VTKEFRKNFLKFGKSGPRVFFRIFKGVWLRHPQLSLFFHVNSILVDRQKEVIHRTANLFSPTLLSLVWLAPELWGVKNHLVFRPHIAFHFQV
jgi:hypothetical protein